QIVGDLGHLAVPSKRHDEVWTGRRQHLSIVREGRRAPQLGRASRDNTAVGVLDGDELHVRHGDEMTQVGGVVECMPMADLDRGDANRHDVLFVDAYSLRWCAPYCVNLRQL